MSRCVATNSGCVVDEDSSSADAESSSDERCGDQKFVTNSGERVSQPKTIDYSFLKLDVVSDDVEIVGQRHEGRDDTIPRNEVASALVRLL